MKIKTADLTGAALDWAVTQLAYEHGAIVEDGFVYTRTDSGLRGSRSNPSTNWTQGGPIIDKYDIDVLRDREMGRDDSCGARTGSMVKHPTRSVLLWVTQKGPTKLVAAMRCFVASKLGDEVDVPEELMA